MACAADIVGAAMARPLRGSEWQCLGLDGQDCYAIVSRPGVPPLDRKPSSCGVQVRIYDVHYASLAEDEVPNSFRGTFLTLELTRHGMKTVTW